MWSWPINHRTRLVLKLTSLRKRRKLFLFPWRPGKKKPSTPFCHQMGPYQTWRVENLWAQLLVRFRVFFYSRNSGDHLNDVPNSRNVFFSEKENVGRPKPRQRGLANRICFQQTPQIPESQIPNLQISESPRSPNPKSGSLQSWMKKQSTNPEDRFS